MSAICWQASAIPANVRGVIMASSSAGAAVVRRPSCASEMIVPGRISSMTARMMPTGVALSAPGACDSWRALLPVLGLSSVPATS
eukprot:1662072-Prorocentrum_lima.AAC.1